LIRWKQHPEYIRFLTEFIPGHSEQDICSEFERSFGITLNRSQIKNFKNAYGVRSGTTGGRFQKGQVSHNKGQKMSPEIREKISHTFFQQGHIPVNHRPIGSERVNVDGYTEVKVQEPNKWRLKQRVVYEAIHGVKLGRDDVIVFLDGNRQNFREDNLLKMSRAGLARYNQDHLYGDNPEINRAAAYIASIKAEIGKNK
jgi:hypothetical protein